MASHSIVQTNVIRRPELDQQTAAYRIFHYERACEVQQMFTMDQGIAKNFGTPTTGNSDWDREMRNAWVSVRLRVPDMIDMLDRGASIAFKDAQVATDTYVDIVKHLREWCRAFELDPNLMTCPLDDMRKLDELASMIFPYANHRLLQGQVEGGYGAYMTKLRQAGRAGVDWRVGGKRGTAPPKDTIKAQYRPLALELADWVHRRTHGE